MTRHILPLLPPHAVYVEPFCGGAAIMFAKGKPDTGGYQEVLNDIQDDLVNAYRVARDPKTRDALLDMLEGTPYSRTEHTTARALRKNPSTDPVTRAWATLVAHGQGILSRPNSPWALSPKPGGTNGKAWANRRDRYPAAFERLREVYIENKDALACIRLWDNPRTLFYCDPPYIATNQGDYAGYKESDLEALLSVLQEVKGSVVLSGYASPLMDSLGPEWERHEFQVYCSATTASGKEISNPERTEIVLVRDRSGDVPAEGRKFLWQPAEARAKSEIIDILDLLGTPA